MLKKKEITKYEILIINYKTISKNYILKALFQLTYFKIEMSMLKDLEKLQKEA